MILWSCYTWDISFFFFTVLILVIKTVCNPDSMRFANGWRASSTRLTWTCLRLHSRPIWIVCPRGPRYVGPLRCPLLQVKGMQCVATLRQMCVSGAAGAVDGVREAVLLTEQQQWNQISGALQHPAPGKQPDPVRISKQKENYTQLSKLLDAVSVFCRFGLLPLSMSNVRKPKSSSRASSHPPVSVAAGVQRFSVILMGWRNATYFPFHCLFDVTR